MRYYFFLLGILGLTLSDCRKLDDFITDSSAKVTFSQDTLRFDTVFTEIGSATRFFKVRNPHNRPIRIAKIGLSLQANVIFNLNIDGIAGRSFENVEIGAQDSIYVFAEVTVNPNAPLTESPFVIHEQVFFETNGNRQYVTLEAWGQNANYIPHRFAKGELAVLDCQGGVVTWADKKPYVIYGILFVSNGTLRVAAGTKIHVHGGFGKRADIGLYNDGRIIVLQDARLELQGNLQQSVTIQGDRLEKEFAQDVGQWGGIQLSRGSRGNVMQNVVVKNSKFGIYVDSAAQLSLRNAQIFNTEGAALLGFRGEIAAQNCLFHSSGGCFGNLYGGNYQFTYCTMANLGTTQPALNLSNSYCAEQDANGNCIRRLVSPLNIRFTNCLIYGNKEDELVLSNVTKPNNFDFLFKNCIVRVKELLKAENTPDFFNQCTDCINATSGARLFKKVSEDNYRLDTLSIAFKKALPVAGIVDDLEGKIRDASHPDIGCYDFPNR